MITVGKLVCLSFIFFGTFALMQVSLPLINFKLWESTLSISSALLVSPQPGGSSAVLGVSIKTENNFPMLVSDKAREKSPGYSSFSLSVPSLKIRGAKVLVDSNDISQGLAHLPGSALPGEKGNVFISGHSALPIFISEAFNNFVVIGNPQKALFATLPKAKKGDLVTVEVGGTKFTYQIESIKIVDPKELSVVAPPDNLGRFLTLMTCVPPGLNTKRLVVLAKMV